MSVCLLNTYKSVPFTLLQQCIDVYRLSVAIVTTHEQLRTAIPDTFLSIPGSRIEESVIPGSPSGVWGRASAEIEFGAFWP